MAGSVNKVILVGNLGKDPEVRMMQDGGKVVNLTVATSENWKDKTTGERKDRTEWHRVVIFNNHLAEIAESFLRKGSKVFVEGQSQTRKWTDQQGQERYVTEVVLSKYRGELTLLDNRQNQESSAISGTTASYGGEINFDSSPEMKGESSRIASPSRDLSTTPPELDDDIPF